MSITMRRIIYATAGVLTVARCTAINWICFRLKVDKVRRKSWIVNSREVHKSWHGYSYRISADVFHEGVDRRGTTYRYYPRRRRGMEGVKNHPKTKCTEPNLMHACVLNRSSALTTPCHYCDYASASLEYRAAGISRTRVFQQ